MTRKHKLPANLTFDVQSGRYRYRSRLTGQKTWFGRNRLKAIDRAKQANHAIEVMQANAEVAQGVPPTVGRVIDLYIENVVPRKPWDDSTRQNHLFALNLYKREFGKRIFAGVDRVFLGDWLTRRCKTGDSYMKHRIRLVDVWVYGISRKIADVNEAAATMKASTSKKLPNNLKIRQRLTLDQYWAIHDQAPLFLQIAMECSLITLQARAEVCEMKLEDKRDGWLYIIRDKTAADTDMAFIRIEVTKEIEELWPRAWSDKIHCPYLVHYLPKSQRPQHLQSKVHPFAVNPGYLTKKFKKVRDQTGLFDHLEPRQRPTFHEIRSLGGRLYRKLGYPNSYIQALMTHTDNKTTEIYLTDPGQLEQYHYRAVKAELRLSDLR